jgi:hypothetical protein
MQKKRRRKSHAWAPLKPVELGINLSYCNIRRHYRLLRSAGLYM